MGANEWKTAAELPTTNPVDANGRIREVDQATERLYESKGSISSIPIYDNDIKNTQEIMI
jgi:hypothetical protein